MSHSFNDIMTSLNHLLEKRAMEELSGGKGGQVVNQTSATKAEVGTSTMAVPDMAKGEVPLSMAAKDVQALTSPEKDKAYQAKALHPASSGYHAAKERMPSYNEPEDVPQPGEQKKEAFQLATKLLHGIDQLLEHEKVAEVQDMNNPLAQVALAKQASFKAGEDFAEAYLQKLMGEQLEKQSTDVIGELQPALSKMVGRGEISQELRDKIVDKVSTSQKDIQDVAKEVGDGKVAAELKKKLDPHAVSDSKGSESVPTQPVYEQGKPDEAKKGEGYVNKDQDQVQAVKKEAADLALAKAHLYEELSKAAQANDPVALAVAKANIVDFIANLRG